MNCTCGARTHEGAVRHAGNCGSGLLRERCAWCGALAMTQVEVVPGRVVKLNTNTHKGKVSKSLMPRLSPACEECAARVVVPVPMPEKWSGDQLRIEGV